MRDNIILFMMRLLFLDLVYFLDETRVEQFFREDADHEGPQEEQCRLESANVSQEIADSVDVSLEIVKLVVESEVNGG